jgi:glycosyltransferase involved in cell wall biosynthesis
VSSPRVAAEETVRPSSRLEAHAADPSPVAVSVIVPVTARCDDLGEVYRTHAEVLTRSGRSFEFIFVLDGGFEDAARALEPLRAAGAPIRVLTLPRPFGESTALTVGFEQARGALLVMLPAFFQTAPDGIARVLERLEDPGHDLVVARRWPRRDSWINRVQNYGFHLLVHRLTGTRFHDLGCALRGLRRPVAMEIDLYGDLHRFFALLAHHRGFHVSEVSVPQHPADGAIRVYGPGVYLRRLLDILTLVFLFKFTRKPLRLFGLIGGALFGSGFLISLVLTLERMLGGMPLGDRPLLLLGILLMVLGVQIGSIGLLGELIVFTHARQMKDYTIDQTLD